MKRSMLLAGGILAAVVAGIAPTTAEPQGAATVGPPFVDPRPSISEAARRSSLERLLGGVVAEAEYSGARLGRIATGTRDGMRDLLQDAAAFLPREPVRPTSQALPGAAPPAPAAPRRRALGPDEVRLGAMLEQLYALETPPIAPPPTAESGDRLLQSEPGRGAPATVASAADGSASGARQLLRRLEARGEMNPRWGEEYTRFTAVLPPSVLEARFDAWSLGEATAAAAASEPEEIFGFTSHCFDSQGGPSDPLHLALLSQSGARDAGNGAARSAAAERPQYGAVHLAALIPDEPRRSADGSVFMPKLTQRLLGVRTVLACVDETPRIEQLIGQVISNPNASGLVQAGQTGRIRPGPHGLPELGMTVRQGEPLAVLVPNLTTVDRGQLESQLAELRSDIIRTELELARMRDFPIVPFRTGRMLALRLELDGLRKRRDALIAGIDNHEVLLSPMDGVVSQADTVAGQLVQAGDTLWKIVDPQRLRVEAIAFDEPMARHIHGAWALTSDEEVMRLAFVGRGLALTNQGIPLHFEIRDHAQGLGVGTPVAVYVNAGGGERAVVLPKGALVRDDAGRAVVWEHVEAERFLARPVHAEPLNGQQVLVRDGIAENARIVHVGAAHFGQIR